jgi:hypothetical protein
VLGEAIRSFNWLKDMFHSNYGMADIVRDKLQSRIPMRFGVQHVRGHHKPYQASVYRRARTQEDRSHFRGQLQPLDRGVRWEVDDISPPMKLHAKAALAQPIRASFS